ncbi:hypothetical protein LG634_15515 [Streptomyces bambusae]|uniref:hypothetical protein n=1 Tax=Streptomyces bambusae TaxID=1550616 RepID=UPI001CFE9B7F|nr:hypothetical protein [Streptomyces bambusae]MCB5166237.1 hypothetical protein [Streptomyces bambusae]
MSHEDGYGGYDDEPAGRVGGTGQTRTRLPEPAGDPYGAPRRPARTSRGLVTVVGIVVLLIAAIAFANQGDGEPSDDAKSETPPSSTSTAATGTAPVTGKNAGIPTGFAHDEQGAQSAASNYAVALGSTGMFRKESRHAIVDALYTQDAATQLKGPQDSVYSGDFLRRLGLDANGNPPQGNTFVSRTVPVGSSIKSFNGANAKVAVWYMGLIGMSGPRSTDPVRTSWGTWTFDLTWVNNAWKVVSDEQKDGPAPVPGDVAASTSDDISKAVEEYGGFTYAR